ELTSKTSSTHFTTSHPACAADSRECFACEGYDIRKRIASSGSRRKLPYLHRQFPVVFGFLPQRTPLIEDAMPEYHNQLCFLNYFGLSERPVIDCSHALAANGSFRPWPFAVNA